MTYSKIKFAPLTYRVQVLPTVQVGISTHKRSTCDFYKTELLGIQIVHLWIMREVPVRGCLQLNHFFPYWSFKWGPGDLEHQFPPMCAFLSFFFEKDNFRVSYLLAHIFISLLGLYGTNSDKNEVPMWYFCTKSCVNFLLTPKKDNFSEENVIFLTFQIKNADSLKSYFFILLCWFFYLWVQPSLIQKLMPHS